MSRNSWTNRIGSAANVLGIKRVKFQKPSESSEMRLGLQPIGDLNLMIANGWGDTPQERLPSDWRTRKLPSNGNGRKGPQGPRNTSKVDSGQLSKVDIANPADPAQA